MEGLEEVVSIQQLQKALGTTKGLPVLLHNGYEAFIQEIHKASDPADYLCKMLVKRDVGINVDKYEVMMLRYANGNGCVHHRAYWADKDAVGRYPMDITHIMTEYKND